MPKGIRSYESCLGITQIGKTLLEQDVGGHTMEARVLVTAPGSEVSRLDLKR